MNATCSKFCLLIITLACSASGAVAPGKPTVSVTVTHETRQEADNLKRQITAALRQYDGVVPIEADGHYVINVAVAAPATSATYLERLSEAEIAKLGPNYARQAWYIQTVTLKTPDAQAIAADFETYVLRPAGLAPPRLRNPK